mmetsp:Transcript_43055/g.111511  ORF Transcript_43055/g.111511 Transcript_43055/m.111511 type:complete len:635 (+) Transcript_43055:1831-3735(+)
MSGTNESYVSNYIGAVNISKPRKLFHILEESRSLARREDCISLDVGNYDYDLSLPQDPAMYESHIESTEEVQCITQNAFEKMVDLALKDDPNAGERTTDHVENSELLTWMISWKSDIPLGSDAFIHRLVHQCADPTKADMNADIPGMNGPSETTDRMSRCVASQFYRWLDSVEEAPPMLHFTASWIPFIAFICLTCCLGILFTFAHKHKKEKNALYVLWSVLAAFVLLGVLVTLYVCVEYFLVQTGQIQTGTGMDALRTLFSVASHPNPTQVPVSGEKTRVYRFVSDLHDCRHHITEGAWVTLDSRPSNVFVRVGEKGENVYVHPDGSPLHEPAVINGIKYLTLSLDDVEGRPGSLTDTEKEMLNLAILHLTPKEYLRNSAFCNNNKDDAYGRVVYKSGDKCFADAVRMDPKKRGKALEGVENETQSAPLLDEGVYPKNVCVLFEEEDPIYGKVILDSNIVSGSMCPSATTIDGIKYKGNFIPSIPSNVRFGVINPDHELWYLAGSKGISSDPRFFMEELTEAIDGGAYGSMSMFTNGTINHSRAFEIRKQMTKGNDRIQVKGWLSKHTHTLDEMYGVHSTGSYIDLVSAFLNLPSMNGQGDTFRAAGTYVPTIPPEKVRLGPLALYQRPPLET